MKTFYIFGQRYQNFLKFRFVVLRHKEPEVLKKLLPEKSSIPKT